MNKFRFFGFLFSKIRTPHQLIAKCFKKSMVDTFYDFLSICCFINFNRRVLVKYLRMPIERYQIMLAPTFHLQ